MKLLRTFLLSLLVHALIFPALIFANTPTPVEEMSWTVTEYGKHATFKDQVNWLNSMDAKRGHELEEYLKKSNVDLNMTVPSLSFSNGIMRASIEGKMFEFVADAKNNVIVTYGKKSIVVNDRMSLEQIKTELTKLTQTSKVSSLLNLVISSAHAQVGPEALGMLSLIGLVMLCAIIIGAVKFVYNLFTKKNHPKEEKPNAKAITEAARELCDQLSNKTPAEIASQTILVETYNKVQQAYADICKGNSKKEECESMKTARNCLSMALEKAKSVNDSGRGSNKQQERGTPAVNTNSTKAVSK